MSKVILAILITMGSILASPALAQNYVSWVSSTGNDANNCSRPTPCSSINGAINKTSAGGSVFCVDAVAAQNFSIFKAITIDCSDVAATNVYPNGGIGNITIDVAATDRVVLRGVRLLYPTLPNGGVIAIAGAGSIIIDKSVISGGNSPNSSAISVAPTGAIKLTITDTLISGGGAATTGAGVRIFPSSAGTAQVTIERCNVSNNIFGIAVDGSGSTGGINATVSDSLMSNNKFDGLIATSSASGAPIGVTVTNSRSLNNGYGIRSLGGNVTVRSDGSRIIGNGVGVSGGGALLSAGNNIVEANAANGTFTGAIAFK